jgi:hypothetical protein
VSDDLERLLRDVPGRAPRPDADVTRRVRDRVLNTVPKRRIVSAGVVAALVVGMAIGYWAIPQEEPAIGAADPPQIAIAVKPTIFKRWTPVDVAGRIAAKRSGEHVTLEENVCGRGWNPTFGARTNPNGEFSVSLGGVFSPQGNGFLRARWGDHESNVVRVLVRPVVTLRQRSRRVFETEVASFRALVGRTAQLERYDKERNRWGVAARARLHEGSYTGSTEGTFRVELAKRTIVRAVVSATQARPCHLAGFSNMLTVG